MKNAFKRHQSVIYALGIVLLLSLWLASGYLASDSREPKAADTATRSSVQRVRVRVPDKQRIVEEVVLNGRTEPARAVTIRAEVEGRIVGLPARHGASVAAGDVIARIDSRDRQARLSEAAALLKQRELEYTGSKRLQSRGEPWVRAARVDPGNRRHGNRYADPTAAIHQGYVRDYAIPPESLPRDHARIFAW